MLPPILEVYGDFAKTKEVIVRKSCRWFTECPGEKCGCEEAGGAAQQIMYAPSGVLAGSGPRIVGDENAQRVVEQDLGVIGRDDAHLEVSFEGLRNAAWG